MGSENHLVVDVSSDEEVDDTQVDKSYFDFLNKVLEAVDEKSESSDEVEVISEVKGSIDSAFRKLNSSSQAVNDEDDDDCVILDGDPDKTTTKTASGDDDDKLSKNDDDVLVVGQKGEIACRDFPHPRHSCAKYSFNSTSHEKYCDMCHCYVCDIPAPCPYWCIGVSTIDHCHANDKDKLWKNQREYFRTGVLPTEPSPKPSIPRPPPSILSRPPTQNLIQLSTLAQKQVGIRPCSSSTRAANARVRCRIKQSVSQLQNRAVQSLSVRNNVIQKDRSPCTINLRSRVAGPGIRYGATNGKSIKANPQISSIVAPTINLGMYTQQPRGYQPNATSFCAAMSGQNTSGSQFQRNAAETPLTTTAAAAETVQEQQAGVNENVLQTRLYEFESWLLMDQTGPVCPLPEAVSEEQCQPLTFDFETLFE